MDINMTVNNKMFEGLRQVQKAGERLAAAIRSFTETVAGPRVKKKNANGIRWMKRRDYQSFESRKYNSLKGYGCPYMEGYYDAKNACVVKRLRKYVLPEGLAMLYMPDLDSCVLNMPVKRSLDNKTRRRRQAMERTEIAARAHPEEFVLVRVLRVS